MQVLLGKYCGFCAGVRKAVDTALSVYPENTYILGELIHNPEVVERITARGIPTVEDVEEVPDGATLLIRSHGAGKAVYEECAAKGIVIVDCTCTFVQRSQRIVYEQSALGRTIVIIGHPSHPETIGLLGWVCEGGEAYVFSSPDDDFGILKDKDVSVVAQTTFSEQSFSQTCENLRKVCQKTVEIFKTICYTTVCRQREAFEIARRSEAVLVIGGRNSSNTGKLYEIASKNCGNVYWLQDAEAFEYEKIKFFNRVGVIAGASTPDWQTQEVLFKMEESNAEVQATTMQDVVEEMGIVMEVTPRVKLSQKMVKKLREEEEMLKEIEDGKEFTVTCTGFNKGGLTSELGTYPVFVPAKEIRTGYVRDLEKYVGKKLRLKLLEIRKERRKEIIASQRVILEAEKEAREAAKAAKEEAFFDSIHAGDVVEGKVERVTNFGAFVSVNGFDCLAHISDLAWSSVKNVTDVLEIGKRYQFKVLSVDREKKKVSIGYKQLQPQPWDLAAEKYHEGDIVHGKVVRILSYGAFVELEKGIDGLVHVSQISHEWLDNPTSVLSIGEEVDAKILAFNADEKRITLSIKALQPKPEQEYRSERTERSDRENGRSKGRKGGRKNFNAPEGEEDEYREWKEGGYGGASIAEILHLDGEAEEK